MSTTIRTVEEGVPEGAMEMIGQFCPQLNQYSSKNLDRFMLVGFHPVDHGQGLIPVWRDTKSCRKEARSKY